MQKQKVLVTGSSGRAGRAIIQQLSDRFEVIGFDMSPGENTSVIGNLTDRTLIKDLAKSVDVIIHTASLHAPHVATHSREDFVDTNIKGTLFLLEAAKLNGVKKLIYTSTTSLYGESMHDPDAAVWITEEVPVRPRDIYDITKIAAEELCRDFFDAERLQTCSLRVSRFWDEPLDKKVFYRMYRGLDARDVAVAHQLAIDAPLQNFEAFNISAQSIFEIADLYNLRNNLHPLLQARIPELIKFFDAQGWELPEYIDRVYVIDKAKKMLQFNPSFNIHEMMVELSG